MFKIFAAVLIIAAFASAGRYFALLDKKRAQTLESILLMLSITETQLRYSRMPVSDLLKSLCENNALTGLDFLRECRELLCFGESFSSAWKRSIEASAELKKLLPETYDNLLVLGDEIGATDLDGQLSRCEYYNRLFTRVLSERQEKSRRSAKLFPPLGALIGFSVVILLV